MKIKNKEIWSHIGIIISVLAGLIGIYAQFKDPKTGLILFIALLVGIFGFFLISLPISYFKRKFKLIEDNLKEIENIKKDLNNVKDKLHYNKEIAKLGARISFVEKMRNKKGLIDPRIILIIIIIVLLLLLLRSKGII